MRQIINSFFLTCFFLSLSQPVLAEDDEVSIVGGVAYNWKNEDFKITGKPFKPEFTTIDWSIIAAYKSAYVKVNFDQSIKDSFQIDNSENSSGNVDNQAIFFSRDDIGLTFGYSVLDNVSLFVGYTRGETEGTGTGQIGNEGAGPVFSTTSVSIKEQGPFVGFSYSYYLKDSGSFSFALAYAQLDGEVSLQRTDTLISDGSESYIPLIIKGEADGLSYSITWTDQFSEAMLYNISLKSTNYRFDAPPVGTDDFDFDDTYTILSIGLSRFF